MAYTISVGDHFVHALSDGHFDLPAQYFLNAAEEGVTGLPETVRVGANVFVVDAGERRFLVDGGSGTALNGMFDTLGALPAQMAAAGIERSSITDIILTHMHIDHIGGLVADGAPRFPGVPVHVSDAEWAFWTDPALPGAVPDEVRPRVELTQALAAPLADAAVRHIGPTDLGDGVRLVPAPGHTPGHTAVQVGGGTEPLLIMGDVVVSEAIQFSHPGVTYALDSDPAQAVATRKAALAAAAADRFLIAATHLTFPGLGHVEAEGEAFRFLPVRTDTE